MDSEHTCHLVVDGSNMLHRVLHVPSLQNLKTSKGVFTGGVYGFLKTLRVAVREFAYLGTCSVVWDSGRSSRRRSILPEYKHSDAVHQPIILEDTTEFQYMDEYLRQREVLKGILRILGVRSIEVPGKEADDIICEVVDGLGENAVVVSEDRDFFQLVSSLTKIYRPIAEELVTEESIQNEYGFGPDKYLWYHAICGDGSDNIGGIAGVGSGTAIKVVQNADSIQEMFIWSDAHKHLRVRKVAQHFDVVLRNLELVELSKEEFSAIESRYIDHVLREKLPPFDLMAFSEKALELEMESISEHARSWVEPFLDLR